MRAKRGLGGQEGGQRERKQYPREGNKYHSNGIQWGTQDFRREPTNAEKAYEQGALPTLSMLLGEVTVRVSPRDKMYQAMEIEPNFMRPVILHGFGTNAKKANSTESWKRCGKVKY